MGLNRLTQAVCTASATREAVVIVMISDCFRESGLPILHDTAEHTFYKES